MEMQKHLNILDLPFDVWTNIIQHLAFSDLAKFGQVCTRFQELLRNIKLKQIDLNHNCNLNENYLLNEAVSKRCTSINLNHCYWLEPNTIRGIISRANLKELHVVECQIDASVVLVISDLNLSSLSLSCTNVWLHYWQLHRNQSLACFRGIKTLQVFCPVINRLSIAYCLWNLCETLLPHCKTLEHLSLYTSPHQALSSSPLFYGFELIDKFKKLHADSTPVPNLKSLEIDLVDCSTITVYIDEFFKVILRNKTIPLEHVYFGRHTIQLIMFASFVNNLSLIKNSSTFCLSALHQSLAFNLYSKQFSWERMEEVKLMLKKLNYKKIVMENLVFDNFLPIAFIIAKNSSKTVEEINFHGSISNSNLSMGIQIISHCCVKLTSLNLCFQNWRENNEHVLDMLSNLSHLQTLHLPSFALGIRAEYNSGAKNVLPIETTLPVFSFWKVTTKCRQLKEIRIVHIGEVSKQFSVIHEVTLSYIKQCENLRELHLASFYTVGMEYALPKITQKCAKLESLYVVNVINLKDNGEILFMTESLRHAKSIKLLSFKQSTEMSTEFVKTLNSCENLEKLYLDNLFFKRNVCQCLARCLPKMKNLCMIYLRNYSNSKHDSVLNKPLKILKNLKAAFYFKLESLEENKFDEIPVAHLHMLQYVPKIIAIV